MEVVDLVNAISVDGIPILLEPLGLGDLSLASSSLGADLDYMTQYGDDTIW